MIKSFIEMKNRDKTNKTKIKLKNSKKPREIGKTKSLQKKKYYNMITMNKSDVQRRLIENVQKNHSTRKARN